MSSDGPRITVGTRWITVCNGIWHAIFLEDDGGMYPGSCNCDEDREKARVLRTFNGFGEVNADQEQKSISNRGRREPSA
jgi:hypothetical protein